MEIKSRDNYDNIIKKTDEHLELLTPFTPKLIMRAINYYQKHYYFYISFSIIDNLKTCHDIAKKISDDYVGYQGNDITEVQINNQSFSLSIDQWVDCTRIFDHNNINTNIQYYILTEHGFPKIIFFRILKSEKDYEIKLKYFINSMLNNIDKNNIECNYEENNVIMFDDVNNDITDNTTDAIDNMIISTNDNIIDDKINNKLCIPNNMSAKYELLKYLIILSLIIMPLFPICLSFF